MIVKCKKCSSQLLETEDRYILSTHSATTAEATDGADRAATCRTEMDNAEVFVHEDHLPGWMQAEIEQSQWTKGKLKCAKCGLKVGSFDFVSGTRCKCELNSVLPAVHFNRSKVDLRK